MKIVSVFFLALAVLLSGCSNPIQSGNVSVNPLSGTIDGSLVFKDGRWVKVIRAPRDVDPCGNVRAVAPVVEFSAFVRPVQVKQVVARGRVECKTQKLRESNVYVYDTCGRKSRAVVGVQPASLWYRFTHPCAHYDAVPVEQAPVEVAPSGPQVGDVITTTTTPATPADNTDIPESGVIGKSIQQHERRVSDLERSVSELNAKADLILSKLGKK